MAFLTIYPAPDLNESARRRAIEAGPPGTALRSSHESLLASARFVDVEAHDLTDSYRETQRKWIDGYTQHEREIRVLLGDEDFEERVQRRRRSLAAIDAGLLRRSLYLATA